MLPITALLDVGMRVLDKFIPDPEAKAKAQAELLQMQQEGRLAELNADNVEAQELTKRQAADMASDSWMSKNIRPMTLIFILAGYFTFAMMSAYGYEANQNYVGLQAGAEAGGEVVVGGLVEEAQELTKRQTADMSSDSWLSKNIRPMTLIFILAGYFTFAMMSAYGYEANQNYVTLLGNWGMLVMSFYFGGRTLEKIMDMKAKKND